MKAPKINQAEDKILDEYLAGKSHLSDSYKQIALDLPGVEIDSSILAASRREVNARPKPLGAEGWRKWQMPFSIAAVLVISASLTLTLVDYENKSDEIPIESAPIVLNEQAKATRGDSFGNDKVASVDTVKSATSPMRKLEPVERATQKMASAPIPETKVPEPKSAQIMKAPLPTSGRAEAPPQAFPPTVMKNADAELQIPAKVLSSDQVRISTAESRQRSDAPVTVAAPALAAEAKLASANVADKTSTTTTSAPASAPAPPAAPAPFAPPPSASMPFIAATTAPASATAADTTMASAQTKSARVAANAPIAVMAENATGSAAQAQRKNEPQSESATAAAYGAAQTWLAKIEALLREGKTEEAEQTLADFKKRFPNYVTPDSIKEALAKQRADLNIESK
jgi:hypothetical protein